MSCVHHIHFLTTSVTSFTSYDLVDTLSTLLIDYNSSQPVGKSTSSCKIIYRIRKKWSSAKQNHVHFFITFDSSLLLFFSCEMLDVLPLQASKHDLKESWKKSFFGGSVWWGLRVTLKLLYTTKSNIMCVGSKTLANQSLRPWSGKIHD